MAFTLAWLRMLSFSDCRMVMALISQLLDMQPLSSSEHLGCPRQSKLGLLLRYHLWHFCTKRHSFALLFKKCSLLLIVLQSRWEYWIRYLGAKVRNGCCLRGPTSSYQQLVPLRRGHRDRRTTSV